LTGFIRAINCLTTLVTSLTSESMLNSFQLRWGLCRYWFGNFWVPIKMLDGVQSVRVQKRHEYSFQSFCWGRTGARLTPAGSCLQKCK